MEGSQVAANALPFFMAFVLLALRSGNERLAQNMARVLSAPDQKMDSLAITFAVSLTLHFYRQLSFVLSLFLSSVSALGLTLTSSRPLVGVLVVFVLVVVLAVWFFHWQTLGTGDKTERDAADSRMTVASWAVTFLMLALTLYARWPRQAL